MNSLFSAKRMLLEKQSLSKRKPHFSIGVVADICIGDGFFATCAIMCTLSVRICAYALCKSHPIHSCFRIIFLQDVGHGFSRFNLDM